MESPNEILTAGIDYFTVTAKLGQAETLYKPARAIFEALSDRFRAKTWKFYGYRGWIFSAHPVGHFAYGEANNDLMGAIVQASGNFAANNWDKFLGDASRFTRLDLMVDCKLEAPQTGLAKICYDWILKNGTHTRRYSLIQNNMKGETLYVGSRQSQQFGRMYDKSAETPNGDPPGSIWRYELELKDDAAKHVVSQIRQMGELYASLNSIIVRTVYDWFDQRNVPPVFGRKDGPMLNLKMTGYTRHESQRILWLKQQVAPTVRALLANNDREVLDVLGITDFYRLTRRKPVRNLDK